jgi:hypothetical protein
MGQTILASATVGPRVEALARKVIGGAEFVSVDASGGGGGGDAGGGGGGHIVPATLDQR